MPRLHLTKSAIDAIEPTLKDVVHWDDGLKGFGLKVTPLGRKVFIVLYRTKDGFGRLRKYTIGPYGPVTPMVARAAAQKILAARQDGRDPQGEKQDQRRRVIMDLVEAVVADYQKRHVDGTRSASQTNRILEREVLASWRGRSIHEITRRDVLALLDAIVDRGSPAMANRVFICVRALFNWAIGRGLIDKSPCAGLHKPALEHARDRVLEDEELKCILMALRGMSDPFAAIVEVLCLTGQRRSEVAHMMWPEVDLAKSTWTIPASRSKNGKPHLVHLSAPVLAVLERQERTGMLVFPVKPGRPFAFFTDSKRRLDELSGVTGWVLHDLRRTVVSGMARLGVAPHVADKILNHQSGTISGVAAIYQRHEFLAERKAALDLWGKHVQTLCVEQKQETVRTAA